MALFNSVLQMFTSFIPGYRQIDGGELQTMAQMLLSAKSGIVAFAGGGQSSATRLTAAMNLVETVASAADSVMLPQAIPGTRVYINNATATSMQVFGMASNPNTGVGDTIAATNSNTQQATATGVAQTTTTMMQYSCMKAGQWKQSSMA